jgi:hypothetical protein
MIHGIDLDARVPVVLSGSADGRTWTQLDASSFPGLRDAFSGSLSEGPLGFATLGKVYVDGTSIPAVWTSRDGQAWTEAEALRDVGIDRIVITANAFVAVRTGRHDVTPLMWISADGVSWGDLPTGERSPLGTWGTAITVPVEILGRLLVVRGGSILSIQTDPARSDPPLSVWLGTSDPKPGAESTWMHQTEADPLLVDAGVVTVTAVPSGVEILGYDRSSLEPLAWTSPDGQAWRRTALGSGAFGGGVPDLVVRGGRSLVAIESDPGSNLRASVPRIWRSDDGISWSPAAIELLGSSPSEPVASCPSGPPYSLEAMSALDENLVVDCFGRDPLTIDGYVRGCGGCGGTSPFVSSPAWLLDPLGYSTFWLAARLAAEGEDVGSIGVWVDPADGLKVPEIGTHIALTGHFDDPAATTCRVVPWVNIGVPLPNPADAVAICRRSFVASKIRVVTP